MSVSSPAFPLELEHLAEARALARTGGPSNILAVNLLDQVISAGSMEGLHAWGTWATRPRRIRFVPGRRALTGFVLITGGGLTLPFATDPEDAWALGRATRSYFAVGMVLALREMGDHFWAGFGMESPRLWYDQRLFVGDRPSRGPMPQGFRLAVPEDLDVLISSNSEMMLEDLGFDPAGLDADQHRRSILKRIEREQTYVVAQEGQILFKIDVGAWSEDGVMVGGTYVPPAWRNQGVATRAMRALQHVLLESHPRVVLHVNERNAPAMRVYRAAGMVPTDAMRLVMPY